ncbi:MAG: hypothetical protein U0519_04510 [Candidatus Gracilibacteria bacterium]
MEAAMQMSDRFHGYFCSPAILMAWENFSQNPGWRSVVLASMSARNDEVIEERSITINGSERIISKLRRWIGDQPYPPHPEKHDTQPAENDMSKSGNRPYCPLPGPPSSMPKSRSPTIFLKERFQVKIEANEHHQFFEKK